MFAVLLYRHGAFCEKRRSGTGRLIPCIGCVQAR